jgi:hypothetical protein
MQCMFFLFDATATRPFNPLRTNRGRLTPNGSPWLRAPVGLDLCGTVSGARDRADPCVARRAAASRDVSGAPVGLDTCKAVARDRADPCKTSRSPQQGRPLHGPPCRQQHAQRVGLGAPVGSYLRKAVARDRADPCVARRLSVPDLRKPALPRPARGRQ